MLTAILAIVTVAALCVARRARTEQRKAEAWAAHWEREAREHSAYWAERAREPVA